MAAATSSATQNAVEIHRICFNCRISLDTQVEIAAKRGITCTKDDGATYCSQACMQSDWHLHRAVCKLEGPDPAKAWRFFAGGLKAHSADKNSSQGGFVDGTDYIELLYNPQNKEFISGRPVSLSEEVSTSNHFKHLSERIKKQQPHEMVVVARPDGQPNVEYTALYMFKSVIVPLNHQDESKDSKG